MVLAGVVLAPLFRRVGMFVDPVVSLADVLARLLLRKGAGGKNG